jgi:hypothetical protein
MKKVKISQIDTLFVNGSYPIEFLFYYNYKIHSKTIRKALKKVSLSFWPLFGVYGNGWIHSSKYLEEKFLRETVFKEDFDYTLTVMDIWEKYNNVNPQKMDGLFFMSILQFNNGTVIIPKMNHLAGDGYSYFYFLSLLAAMSKSFYIPFKKYAIRQLFSPKLNRTVIEDFYFDKTNIKEQFKHQNCKIKIEKVNKTYVHQEIKKIITNNNINVTANDILSAMIFKRTVDLQKSTNNNHFTLSIPMDVRRQVKELGSKFFGNGLMFHHLTSNTDEIDNYNITELALNLRKSLPKMNKALYVKYLADLELKIDESSIHSLEPYDPEKGCLVTNLSKMPIQKLDFGSGGPEFVFLLTIGRNSTAILADKDDYLLRLVN